MRTRPTPKARASRATSTKSSRPARIPATPRPNSASARRRSTIARWWRPAARRPTGSSRTTSALRATIKPSTTSTTKTARAYDNWVGAPMAPTANISYAGGTLYNMGPFNYGALRDDLGARRRCELPRRHPAQVRRRPRRRPAAVGQRIAAQRLLLSDDQRHHVDGGCGGVTTAVCSAPTQYRSRHRVVRRRLPAELSGCRRPYVLASPVSRRSEAGRHVLLSQQHESDGVHYSRPGQRNPGLGLRDSEHGSDTIWNNQDIVKLQYTKNFGSTSFLRLYGYTYYSDWLQNAVADDVCGLCGLLLPTTS